MKMFWLDSESIGILSLATYLHSSPTYGIYILYWWILDDIKESDGVQYIYSVFLWGLYYSTIVVYIKYTAIRSEAV